MLKEFSKEDKEKCMPFIQQAIDFYYTALDKGVMELDKKTTQPNVDPLLKLAAELITYGISDFELIKKIYGYVNETCEKHYEKHEFLKIQITIELIYCINTNQSLNFLMEKFVHYGFEGIEKLVDKRINILFINMTTEEKNKWLSDRMAPDIETEAKEAWYNTFILGRR